MGTATGRETDALASSQSWRRAVPARLLPDAAPAGVPVAEKPRWGQARRPVDEPVRLGQDSGLVVCARSAGLLRTPAGKIPRLQVRLFGLFGPNGALPIHLTEYARERLQHAGDPTFCRFLDISIIGSSRSSTRLGSSAAARQSGSPEGGPLHDLRRGLRRNGASAFRDRDALPDLAKLFHVGALIRQVRNGEGLAHILQHFFRVPVHIEEFVGHWLSLSTGQRTFLSSEGAPLGAGAVLGGRVWTVSTSSGFASGR